MTEKAVEEAVKASVPLMVACLQSHVKKAKQARSAIGKLDARPRGGLHAHEVSQRSRPPPAVDRSLLVRRWGYVCEVFEDMRRPV